jgi:hypothetical protein
MIIIVVDLPFTYIFGNASRSLKAVLVEKKVQVNKRTNVLKQKLLFLWSEVKEDLHNPFLDHYLIYGRIFTFTVRNLEHE